MSIFTFTDNSDSFLQIFISHANNVIMEHTLFHLLVVYTFKATP